MLNRNRNRQYGRAATILVLALIAWNWWQLTACQPLAPPDFYRYHSDSERLWRGEWEGMHLPPLYPLITGSTGRLLALLIPRREAFILGGKILSLLSALGVFFFFRALVGRVIPERPALAAATLLVLSPMVMKFTALPLTDLPFLALILGAIAAMFADRRWLAAGLTLAAAGIRFEGLLLLLLIALLTMPLRRGRWLLWTPILMLASADLLYLSARYSPRVINYIEQFFIGRTPTLWDQPLLLLRVLSRNLLFFLPSNWPESVFLAMAAILALMIMAGIGSAWKVNRRATLLVLLFVAGFVVVKGYILFEGDWRLHTRRMLPVLALCTALAVLGFWKLVSSLQRFPRFFWIMRLGLPLIFALGLILDPHSWPWWVVLILLPVAWYCMGVPGPRASGRVVATLALAVIFAATAGSGFRQAVRVVTAMPNPAAVTVAHWFDSTRSEERGRVLLLVNPHMVRYYLERPATWLEWKTPHWDAKTPLEPYWFRFMRKLHGNRIDKVVIDRYMPATPSREIFSLKSLIWRQWRDHRLFKSADFLTSNGELHAMILTPQLDREIPERVP